MGKGPTYGEFSFPKEAGFTGSAGIQQVRGYARGGKPKVEKVMHEFGKGELKSGSKSGPTVTNPKQAVAIALNEAGLSKKASGGRVEGSGEKRVRRRKDLARLAEGGSSDNWIADAVPAKNKGLLHEKLAVPKGENIPAKQLSAAAKKPGKLGQEARFAQNVRGLKKGGQIKGPLGQAAEEAEDKAMVKKAIKQHEQHDHRGQPLTKVKLKRGGVPAYQSKPLVGC